MVMSVAVGAEARLWRLPIVETPAISEGYALVGSFGIGATLYDRMQGTIRVSEQHSDFFVRNAIVILAEQRLAKGRRNVFAPGALPGIPRPRPRGPARAGRG